MLTLDEKRKVKDVLSDGLGIRKDINLAYFLTEIDETNTKVSEIESKFDRILYNQRILDSKLDRLIALIGKK